MQATGLTAAAFCFLCGVAASAQQTPVQVREWLIIVPAALDCSKLPALEVKGPATLLDAANRSALDAVAAALSGNLRGRCPQMSEVVLVSGRSRRLVRLPEETAAPAVQQPAAPAAETNSRMQPVAAPARVSLRYPDRQLPSLESQRGIDEKCELLLRWLGRVHQEMPQTAGQRFLTPALAMGLLRDEDFRQVFGQTLDQTTTKWRAEIHGKVIGRCQGASSAGGLVTRQTGFGRQPVLTAYASQFAPFRQLLDGVFLSQMGPYSPQAANAAVARARQARQWMDTALAEAESSEPTAESCIALRKKAEQGRAEVALLWPSEQKHFFGAMETRATEIAGSAADRWTSEIERYGGTLEDAQRLTAALAERQELLVVAGKDRRERVLAKYHAKLDAILAPLVAEKVEELRKTPGTLEGARHVRAWRLAFDNQFRAYAGRPPLASAEEAFAWERRRVLESALPEWRKAVESTSATAAGLESHARTVAELFPAGPADPLYAGYEAPLKVQAEKKRRVELAAAAASCDALAAHPDDPEAAAKGVPESRLDAAAAATACEAAQQLHAESPRVAFQLARAYLKLERYEEAIEHLLFSAKQGYGAALAYLGDLHLDGAPGIEADPEVAHSLYQRAAEAGFKPAKAVLAEFEEMTDQFAAAEAEEQEYLAANPEPEEPAVMAAAAVLNTSFKNPEIVDNILKGDLDAVPFNELYTKMYLANMAEEVAAMCEGAHFTAREVKELKLETALKSTDMSTSGGAAILMGSLMSLAQMVQNPEASMRRMARAEMDQEELWQDAMKDAYALMARHSCGSAPLEQWSRHAKAFITNEGAPRLSTDAINGICLREAKPAGRYDTRNFCMCFVGAMAQGPMSRAHRKGLATNFWPTAQKMIAQQPEHYGVCISGFGGR